MTFFHRPLIGFLERGFRSQVDDLFRALRFMLARWMHGLVFFWGLSQGLAAGPVHFTRDVRPLLSDFCFECHGPDDRTRKAELRLDSETALKKVASPEAGRRRSILLERLLSDDPEEQMPPASFRRKLSDEQRNQIVEWIESGAEVSRHWAFDPPERPEVPAVETRFVVRNEIDAFVLDRLGESGLEPSPEADWETLMRRVSLDLLGLPMEAETWRRFKQLGPSSYAQLVDRLLDDPRFGEHQAYSWLEASRYADTDGYQNDRYRYQSAWRDWVIKAFNDNLPYDQFLIDQIAGDLLPGATLTQQIATGFSRNHRINSEDGSIPAEWHVENVADRVDTVGTVFMGLTLGCARCHDHKYDPISQRDYFALFAYFNSIAEWGVGPNNGNSPPFVRVPASWPELSPEENHFSEPDPVKLTRARKEAGNGLRRPQAGGTNTVMVLHELATPRETYLLQRGQYDLPDKGQRIEPDTPVSLGLRLNDLPKNRLGLAQWLTHPENPLTSRVAVNRFWQQIFGIGLVKTSENFGAQGEYPVNPALLDWLAVRFVESGWNVKGLLRHLVMSATYRQRSIMTAPHRLLDPENRLLARGARYRLPAPVLRDQALAVGGLLVDQRYGRSAKPYMPPKIWKAFSNNVYQRDTGANLYRRSLYTYWRRTIPPPTMVNFNAANREVCSVRLERTNTPLQALTLMNNVTFVEAARALAANAFLAHADLESQLRLMVSRCLGRFPDDAELAILKQVYGAALMEFDDEPSRVEALLRVGDSASVGGEGRAKLAALTMVATTVMNMDEFISKQ